MWRVVLNISILIFWFIAAITLVYTTLFILPEHSVLNSFDLIVSRSSRNLYGEARVSTSEKALILSAVKASDGRILLIDNFLYNYSSPMAGHGKDFVAAADFYNIDWRLLPAIAFQESNLGKKIPKGSHNAFGWAIYTGENKGVYFSSWSDAIFTVSKGLRRYYFDAGMTTPETIAIKYTERANPEWIYAVKTAMEEISTFEN